ncbi:MAG: hypothetical protein WCC60_03625 [Ilumatobacteraceae bacterium]
MQLQRTRRRSAWWVAAVLCATVPAATSSVAHAAPTVPRPPQFLLLSYDNAGNYPVVDRLRGMADRTGARLTFFLSGVFLLDRAHRTTYQPPDRAAGTSAIGFQESYEGRTTQDSVGRLVRSMQAAQMEGDEVGTHLVGHFCGATGIRNWSQSQFAAELAQWKSLTGDVDRNMGLATGGVLRAPLRGGRTPCLEGNPSAYLPAFAAAGMTYDSSTARLINQWPQRQGGVWRFGVTTVRPDGGSPLLGADYNFYVRYGNTGGPARVDRIYRTLKAAFDTAYSGNRAPLEFSGHTTVLMDGAWYEAEERLLAEVCPRPDVRCSTYSEVVSWLDQHADQLPSLQAGAFTDAGVQPVGAHVAAGSRTRVATPVAGRAAALVNLTTVNGERVGYLTADRCDRLPSGPQSFSNNNHVANAARANLSVVPLAPDGAFCVYNSSRTEVIADVLGSVGLGTGLGFVPIRPVRVADTRGRGPLVAGTITRVATGLPGTEAALVNLTTVAAAGDGHITADRCSRLVAGPQAFSNGNFGMVDAFANTSIVELDADGSFCVYNSAPTQLVVDVQGRFDDDAPLGISLVAPTRVADSRNGPHVAAGSVTKVSTGLAGTEAALVNLTAVDGAAFGYVTADKCSRLVAGPQAFSNLNFIPQFAVANMAAVELDADGSFCLYSSTAVHLVVDLQGGFDDAAPMRLTPMAPQRMIDTRTAR